MARLQYVKPNRGFSYRRDISRWEEGGKRVKYGLKDKPELVGVRVMAIPGFVPPPEPTLGVQERARVELPFRCPCSEYWAGLRKGVGKWMRANGRNGGTRRCRLA